MRRRVARRLLMRRGLLVVALAALLGHVCALEPEAAHGPAAPARSTEAAPVHPGEDAPDVHAASCDGIKPTSTGPLVSTLENPPTATVRLARIWSRDPLAASSPSVPRPALFILYGSLLI
jgi:hypothetical protein